MPLTVAEGNERRETSLITAAWVEGMHGTEKACCNYENLENNENMKVHKEQEDTREMISSSNNLESSPPVSAVRPGQGLEAPNRAG